MLSWVAEFLRDIRFGIRHLAKRPGITSIAVLSLALGIMATTAIYSVIHAVVLDPFPYKDVDNLMSVRVWGAGQQGFRLYYSTDQFLEIAERNTIFEGVIASTISDVLWTDSAEPQRLRGNYGTFNTFLVMGVPPLLGRTTLPDDARPDAAPVVVLGYRFWQRQFGGDPGVVGRRLRLNDKVRTVIGVMPKRFMWRGADVYLPITFERGRVVEGVRGVHLLGRLKPDVTEARAEVDLRPIIEELKKREPTQFPDNWRVGLLSFKETFPSSIRENLWILLGAVGLLLLIACANVSNLLLSKASERQREMAMRAALGASRSRLIRQLLTESLLIAVAGGALGVALAFGCLRAILTIVPPNTIPDESEIALNAPVLLFTVLVSGLTSILFGLAPALHTSTSDLANPLREVGRGLQGGARQAWLRKGLVVAEVALSLMLLVGAGLMMRTFMAVQDVELGFRTDRVLTLRVPLPDQRYPDRERRVAFFQELLRRVSAVPGVQAVGLNTGVHPFGNFGAPVEVVGSAQQDTRAVVIHQINADYTKALGIALVAGRLFSESEAIGGRQLAIVNQSFVRGRLDGRDALGRVVRIPRLKQPPFGVADDSFQIVGVVKDTLNRGLTDELIPEVYLPFSVTGRADRLAALAQADPAGITKAVMSQVYSIDKEQPVTDVRTIDIVLQEGVYAGPRFNLALFAVFAALGLTLAVIGVYGVMSSSVAQQTHEIGVRMALGASPGDISRMVVKRGAWLLLIGIAVGLAGSFMMARLLARQVWNVSTFDPITFIAVSLILFIAGLQACLWPARRAARIDPIGALRQE
jgi:putative ABC transport system permease protein